ncbi:Zinc import ATP-binding protein ZnuC [Pelagimonas phthalicica]|uniref:Zinc import ATP-binding protein ZnuC n=1 Tax=Pelagimonas phthalicica TaxID=1037362 RepID=A0A238JBP5_9RHOB|nr:metal ABC transporter ATP-binding protein [Pelagimonas phthalicica]TDS93832.1 zinc transport system ATP-binding protein [Pelagimonas phthalicica]SMX27644.1 Zinc import ATP-binding protein ZnuC [Pelagimonas phthalicica]
MTALIETRGMHVKRGNVTVLRNVDFAIHAGEIVTIVGPNGSGKSSLMKALIGAVTPFQGQVTRKKGLRLGYVPQSLSVDPSMPMTVSRFLDLPRRSPREARQAALADAGASEIADRQLTDLSGGQFQRAMLARALLNKPEILLLDEPTTGLDQPGQAAFYKRIEEVRDNLGCAVLMVSHDLHVVMSASDRVLCVNGHICCEGRPEVVAQAEEYRALFGSGTGGALALYRHQHNHSHDDGASCDHDHQETA